MIVLARGAAIRYELRNKPGMDFHGCSPNYKTVPKPWWPLDRANAIERRHSHGLRSLTNRNLHECFFYVGQTTAQVWPEIRFSRTLTNPEYRKTGEQFWIERFDLK